jgi:hypothetical protein
LLKTATCSRTVEMVDHGRTQPEKTATACVAVLLTPQTPNAAAAGASAPPITPLAG